MTTTTTTTSSMGTMTMAIKVTIHGSHVDTANCKRDGNLTNEFARIIETSVSWLMDDDLLAGIETSRIVESKHSEMERARILAHSSAVVI